ncbi:hypothetical protein OQA88_1162 [Cercophora sp. LCS_1]
MHDLDVLNNRGYRGKGLTELKLSCRLDTIPEEVLRLGDTLEHLDLSNTGMIDVPIQDEEGDFLLSEKWLPHLITFRIANARLSRIPVLRNLPALKHIDFSSNWIEKITRAGIPAQALTINLFKNRIKEIHPQLECKNLRALNLTGNRLEDLPDSIANLTNLVTLRLSSNRLTTLPSSLFNLSELSYLSFSDNPVCITPPATRAPIRRIPWSALTIVRTLYSDFDSTVAHAKWSHNPHFDEDVVIKLFHAHLTGTGTAANEMTLYNRAPPHEGLIVGLGKITGHPEEDIFDDAPLDAPGLYQGGIVIGYLDTDSYVRLVDFNEEMSGDCAMKILMCIAGGLAALHKDGILHGAVTADNVLVSKEMEHAVLGDFGAATMYGNKGGGQVEKFDVRAYGKLLERVRAMIGDNPEWAGTKKWLGELGTVCQGPLNGRFSFEDLRDEIEHMLGFGRMMRLPGDIAPPPAAAAAAAAASASAPEVSATPGEQISASRLLAEAMERVTREAGPLGGRV